MNKCNVHNNRDKRRKTTYETHWNAVGFQCLYKRADHDTISTPHIFILDKSWQNKKNIYQNNNSAQWKRQLKEVTPANTQAERERERAKAKKKFRISTYQYCAVLVLILIFIRSPAATVCVCGSFGALLPLNAEYILITWTGSYAYNMDKNVCTLCFVIWFDVLSMLNYERRAHICVSIKPN